MAPKRPPAVLLELVLRWACPECAHQNIRTKESLLPSPEVRAQLEAEGEDVEEYGETPRFLFCQKCELRVEATDQVDEAGNPKHREDWG